MNGLRNWRDHSSPNLQSERTHVGRSCEIFRILQIELVNCYRAATVISVLLRSRKSVYFSPSYDKSSKNAVSRLVTLTRLCRLITQNRLSFRLKTLPELNRCILTSSRICSSCKNSVLFLQKSQKTYIFGEISCTCTNLKNAIFRVFDIAVQHYSVPHARSIVQNNISKNTPTRSSIFAKFALFGLSRRTSKS